MPIHKLFISFPPTPQNSQLIVDIQTANHQRPSPSGIHHEKKTKRVAKIQTNTITKTCPSDKTQTQ